MTVPCGALFPPLPLRVTLLTSIASKVHRDPALACGAVAEEWPWDTGTLGLFTGSSADGEERPAALGKNV